MNKACRFFLFLFLPLCSAGQQLQQIPHCPSKEIYDLLVDKKGYLWIAHNMGICRYDGVSFTSFSNPGQSAVGMTGLLEDGHGRIWFHNFNGQIFYIEGEKMVYLREYDFRSTSAFPLMVLYNSQVVITSDNGLFICDVNTMKCRKETLKNSLGKTGTYSLSVVKNKILVRSDSTWLTYTQKEGLQRIPPENVTFRKPIMASTLQTKNFGDVCFLVSNAKNTLYGLTLSNNKLTEVFSRVTNAYINTVSVVNDEVWINTRSGSFSLFTNDSINGFNLTSILTTKDGTTWFGSLSNGLLATYKNSGWQTVKVKNIRQGDYIRCMLNNQGHLLLSSQFGKVLQREGHDNNFTEIVAIPLGSGAPESIQYGAENVSFLETSIYLYALNTLTKKLQIIDVNNVKSVAATNDKLLLALSFGLEIKNNPLSKKSNGSNGALPDNALLRINPSNGALMYKTQRCRSVIYDTLQKRILASFSDGLIEIKNRAVKAIQYKNKPLYVSCLASYNNKIYAGTFNSGLFVMHADSMQRIIADEESPLDAIVKIKHCNYHLWIFRAHDIEVLDVRTDKIINMQPLPVDASDITDIEEDSLNIYIATHSGLFSLLKNADNKPMKADADLLYLLVNTLDTIYKNNIILSSDKNNLLFKIEIPEYNNAERLHFKYRLLSDRGGAAWYYTLDAQRDIQFNALKPGSYSLEIIAEKDNEIVSNKPLLYHFTIRQPWYNAWWFYATLVVLIASFFFALYRYRLRQVYKIERIRQKISNDLHDDIGSTLSSINVYSQLAKSAGSKAEYIDSIQSNTVDIINNLDDLVWNINPKNDNLEYLLSRIKLFALPLLGEKGIDCIFKVKGDKLNREMSPNLRANIYLLFKEAINNIVKHAECTECSIYVIEKGKMLRLVIKDNGKGFNTRIINRHRNGLHNMQERTKDINGIITINSTPGTGTEIRITCRLK